MNLPILEFNNLFLDDEDGDHIAGTGITLTFMYSQDAKQILPAFNEMLDAFDEYIFPVKLDSYKRIDWIDYDSSKRKRLLNIFMKDFDYDEELILGRLKGNYQYYGDYGVRLKGRLFDKGGAFNKTSVSAAYFEMPIDEIDKNGINKLIKFIEKISNITPYAHGMCGYTFQYFHRSGRNDIDRWIGDKILRYSGIHPFSNSWEYYCKNNLANINWITLIGNELLENILSDPDFKTSNTGIIFSRLRNGGMFITGEQPSVFDVNNPSDDIFKMQAMMGLVKKIILPNHIQSNDVLNNFLYEEDERQRWINRFIK